MTECALSRPVLCGMCGIPCGIPCAIKPLIFNACAVCAVSILTRTHRRTCVCMRVRVHAHVCRHTAHTAHTAHANQIKHLHVSPYRTTSPTYRTKRKMDRKKQTALIRCTPENAKKFQEVVKTWPQLHDLVKSLQEQNLFPGLRAMQITLTGDDETIAKGLDALIEQNASMAPKTESQP